MQVTEVQVSLIKPKDGLIGFANVVIDDQLFLGSIGIHQKLSGAGFRLTYPTRKVGEVSFDVFHPIRRPIGLAIEQAVLAKLNDVMTKHDARHYCPDPRTL